MDTVSKILFGLWIVLAITGFVMSFWIAQPVVRVVTIIFGILNMLVVMSWFSALIKARKEARKLKKTEE